MAGVAWDLCFFPMVELLLAGDCPAIGYMSWPLESGKNPMRFVLTRVRC